MKQEIVKSVPILVEFFTFWFGSEKTNWKGIQKEFDLINEQINRLKRENKVYQSP